MFASSKEVIEVKKKARDEFVKSSKLSLESSPVDPELAKTLLNSSVEEIAELIKKGKATSENAVSVFGRRALESHEKTNCLTEIMIQEALQIAREKDSSKEGRDLPLFGVPISFKDTFHVKGYDACYGFSSFLNQPSEKDADLVKVMRELGAIPIVKSNVPQTLMAFDSDNPVFGFTSNPWNTKLVPGGSSGGEAALLADGGSPFGFGSDIGGSLRIPAGFCGIYSLKPTHGRFPGVGHCAQSRGQNLVAATTGPMARSFKDLELVTRLILEKDLSQLDPDSLPIPWRKVEVPKKLRFGYFTNDGVIRSTPAVARSVQETVAALRAEGHECFELDLGDFGMKGLELYFNIMGADSGRTLVKPLYPDPMTPAVSALITLTKAPSFLRKTLGYAASYFGERGLSVMLNATPKDTEEFWLWGDRLKQFQLDFWNFWKTQVNEEGHVMDAVICPVMSIPALVHGGTERTAAAAISTFFWNLLDYTVGVVPASAVDSSVDELSQHPDHFKVKQSMLEKIVYGYYDPKLQDGAPLGVQVVGRRWEEEKVLQYMKAVDDALEKSGRKKPHLPRE